MVIGAFPIAKLSVLLIKQISKPIANVCKENAKNHPFFRKYVCMPPAQFYNWCEVKAKMWILNMGRPVNIPVLSQNMAIELGANLLGEAVIFTIGSALLIFEYNRQSNKEAAKEAKRQEEMDYITNTIHDLYFSVQQQQTQLKEMERLVYSLTGKTPSGPGPKSSPPVKPLPPSDSNPPPTDNKPPPKETHCNTPKPLSNIGHKNIIVQLNTPYPDRGIVLQALNYVQMDIFSTNFEADTQTQKEDRPKNQTHKREGLVMSTLSNMESDHKSLF